MHTPRILFVGDPQRSAGQLRVNLLGDNGRGRPQADLPEMGSGSAALVETATSHSKLLEKLEGPPYDLVLADSPHDLSPAEIERIVRERWPGIPIITLCPNSSDEQARRRADQLHLIGEISRDIALVLDLDDLLTIVARRIKQALGYSNVAIGLIEGRMMRVLNTDAPNESVPLPITQPPVPTGIIGWVGATGQPLLVPDVTAGPVIGSVYQTGRPAARSELAVPILVGNQPIGVLAAQSDRVGGLDTDDLQVMQTLAAQIAAAIQNARLLREREQRLHELAALIAASETLAYSLNAEEAMTHVAELMMHLLKMDACVISAYDEDAGTVTALVQYGQQIPTRDLNFPYSLRDYPATAECLHTDQLLVVHADDPVSDPAEQALLRELGAKTLLAVPLTVRGQTIGLVQLFDLNTRQFQPHEISLCQHLAVQAGVALDNARLYQQMSRRTEEVSALLASAAVITSGYTLNERLEAIAQQATDLVAAEGCTIYLLDEDRTWLHPLVALEDYAEEVLATPLRVGEGITGFVARSGVGEIVNDVLSDPRAYQIPGTPREKECLIAVPLVVQGTTIGVMTLVRKGERGFVPHDLELLTSLAHHAAMGIRNARLLEEARHQAQKLQALYTITATAGRSLELAEMLDAALAEVLSATGLQATSVHLVEEDGGLCLVAQQGMPAAMVAARARVRLGEGTIGQVAATGEAQISTWRHSPEVTESFDSIPPAAEITLIALPLSAKEPALSGVKARAVGVLSVAGYGRLTPTAEQMQLLGAIAQQIAVAIENSRLYRALRQRTEILERAYAELAEADRLKDELIQNVSHELRTPLTFVKGYADLLANGDLGPLAPEQLEAVQIIARKANVLTRLVGNIVSLHAIEPTSLMIQLTSVVEMAELAIANLTSEINLEQAGIRLVRNFAPAVPLVWADPDRLVEVFENLINNAIKFSPNGGQVTIRIRPEDDVVVVAVSDTGIGIPPDKLSRIFDRFYQVDGTTTRRFGGVGLGLALCKQIVEAHGGRIFAESQEGRGTTFWFTLRSAVSGQ